MIFVCCGRKTLKRFGFAPIGQIERPIPTTDPWYVRVTWQCQLVMDHYGSWTDTCVSKETYIELVTATTEQKLEELKKAQQGGHVVP